MSNHEPRKNSDNTVAVVGNGVAALLTALLLVKRQWSCVIYSADPVLSSPNVASKTSSRVVALFPTVIEALRSVVSTPHSSGLEGYPLLALSVLDGADVDGVRVDFVAQDFDQPYWAQTISQHSIVDALREAIQHQCHKSKTSNAVPTITNVTSPITAITPDFSHNSASIKTDQEEQHYPLIVMADGGRAKSSQLAGIRLKQRSYDSHVLGAMLHHDPLDGGNTHSLERHTQGRCLTLIPVANDRTSFLWLADSNEIRSLYAMEVPERNHKITEAARSLSPALCINAVDDVGIMPLQSNWGCQGYRGCCVALGDAAHVMVPIAAQGLNNTIKDVFTLVDALPDGRHFPNDTHRADWCNISCGNFSRGSGSSISSGSIHDILRDYSQRRAPDVLKRQLFVHMLSRSIFQGQRGINVARASGLRMVSKSIHLQRSLVRELSVTIPSHMVPR